MTTTYFLNLVAGNIFRSQTTPGIPSAYYIGVSTTTPTVAGGNVTEPSGGAYARVNITSTLGTPSNGLVSNTAAVTMAESTAAWGTATYYVIFDAATGGNLLAFGALSPTRAVDIATSLVFKVGEVKLQVQNP